MEALSSVKIQHVQNPYSDTDPAQVSSRSKATAVEPVRPSNPRASSEGSKGLAPRSNDTGEMMKRVAEAMDQYVRSTQHDLEIKIHEGTGRILIKVVSQETGEVIREIPPEEMLDLAVKMEEMAGVLFHKSV
jgi:flagellar protein FlaG